MRSSKARNHGIRAVAISPKEFETREAFNEAFLAKVDEYKLDLIVLAGFLVTIPEAMTRKYKNRIINIHPSLIPSFCGVGYYGLKVHEAALKRGVKVTGATVHYVDEGVDSGPILLQKAVEVKDGDTPEVLQRRVELIFPTRCGGPDKSMLLDRHIKDGAFWMKFKFCKSRLTY